LGILELLQKGAMRYVSRHLAVTQCMVVSSFPIVSP
jgi:hypothetical protein